MKLTRRVADRAHRLSPEIPTRLAFLYVLAMGLLDWAQAGPSAGSAGHRIELADGSTSGKKMVLLR